MLFKDRKLAASARRVFQLCTGAWFTSYDYLGSLIKQVLTTTNKTYIGNTYHLVPSQYIVVVRLKVSGGFWGAVVDRSF